MPGLFTAYCGTRIVVPLKSIVSANTGAALIGGTCVACNAGASPGMPRVVRTTCAGRCQTTGSRLSNDLELHLRNPAFDHADCLGSRIRQIDRSSGDIRTPVIDANRHGLPGLYVCDAQPRAKWQCSVSGGQLMRIEFFATSRFRIVFVKARDPVGGRLHRCRHDGLCRPC
jgi:hypothetical protein